MEKNLPKIFRYALNIGGYLVYTIVISVIFSFLFPITLKLIGKSIPNPADPIFAKIQIVIALIVLIVTIIYRKYFYMTNFSSYDSIVEKNNEDDFEIFEVKKDRAKVKENIFKADNLETLEEDDDIKIYVDKEIKR